MHNFVAWFILLTCVLACAGNISQAAQHKVSERMALAAFAYNGLLILATVYLAWG